MPIDPGLPGGPGMSNGSDSSDANGSEVVIDPLTGETPSDAYPDGSLDRYTYGPYSYKGFSYVVVLIEMVGGLPGQPEEFNTQWVFEVSDQLGASQARYNGTGTSLEDCRAQAETWIDAEVAGEDPIEFGEEVEVGQDSIDTFYGAYQNCFVVGIPLHEMDFVQTSETPVNQFVQNMEDSSFFVIELPPNWKAQFQVKIEAIDTSIPAATREPPYAETFTVALDGGESLELGYNSLHVWKGGNDKIDQFSLDQLGNLYTEIKVTLSKDFVQSCPPEPVQEDEPQQTTDTDETNTDEDKGGGSEGGWMDGEWSQDTLWTILGLLVILLMIGWFTSTVRDSNGGV